MQALFYMPQQSGITVLRRSPSGVRSSPPSLPAGVLTQVAAAALASLGWEFRL